MCDFYDRWHTILEGTHEEETPPKRTLRDSLRKKIRDSTIMKFDLSLYDQLPDSDVRKTYELLRSLIVKRINLDLDRKQRNMQEKEKAWTEVTNPSKPGETATKAEKQKAEKEKEKQEKEKKEKDRKETDKEEKAKKDNEKKEKEKEQKEKEKKDKEDKPSAPVVPDPKAKTHPHPKGKGRGSRSESPGTGENGEEALLFPPSEA